jgi:hypothetical protein
MKKIILALILLILLSIFVLAVTNLTKEQRVSYNTCRRNCSATKTLDKRECNTVSFACGKACLEDRSNRDDENRNQYRNCTDECNANIPENLTKKDIVGYRVSCRKNCSVEWRNARKDSNSDYRECKGICQSDKNTCKKNANDNGFLCTDNCFEVALNNGTQINDSIHNDTQDNETGDNETTKIFCPKDPSDECLEEYAPVCTNKGTEFPNACIACNVKGVVWYINGSCSAA